VAEEGYDTDDEIVGAVAFALAHDHPGDPELAARVARLAPAVFDELHDDEAAWPIPTDNDRLDRAFGALEKDGIHTLQNWYGCQEVADEEMRHEIQARRMVHRPTRGFAFFHGGETRRAIAGEGLRISWGAVLPRRVAKATKEKAAWEIAQEIHRALWAQGLKPAWSQVVGEPISLPFVWRRRRKRYLSPPAAHPSTVRLASRDEPGPFEPPPIDEFYDMLRGWKPKPKPPDGR
jgi:hypothetical protein